MTKRDWLINIGIVIVLILLVVVVVVKFIIPKSDRPVDIKEINKITLLDLSGTPINWDRVLAEKGPTYCLVLDLKDCYSCIYDGIEEMKALKKSGQYGVVIVIHDEIDNVKGWSTIHDYTPFYMIKKADFYHHIRTPITPVLLHIEDNKLENFRFIRK